LELKLKLKRLILNIFGHFIGLHYLFNCMLVRVRPPVCLFINWLARYKWNLVPENMSVLDSVFLFSARLWRHHQFLCHFLCFTAVLVWS